MPIRPFTFALRGMFYGRYGSDAEDFRLPTLYLGYPGPGARLRLGIVRSVASAASPSTGRARCSIGCSAAGSPSSTPSCASRCGARSAATTSTVRCRSRWRSSPTAAWRGVRATRPASAATEQEPVVERRRGDARQPLRLRGRRDRLRPAARSPGPRLALAVQSDAGILKVQQLQRVQEVQRFEGVQEVQRFRRGSDRTFSEPLSRISSMSSPSGAREPPTPAPPSSPSPRPATASREPRTANREPRTEN